ncbi:MAG: ATP-binding protein [Gammaproteobacteria bacterium]|nr:ATP-binding protein [Gammaproteobacteria bacterium]
MPESSADLTWKPLRLLTFYRVILAGLLTVLYFTIGDQTMLGIEQPALYRLTCLSYLLFSLLAGFTARLRRPGYRLQTISQVLVDIGAITLLIFASGGPSSGLGILLIISVATGSILLPGRMAFLFAAVAAIALMGEQFYGSLQPGIERSVSYTQTGLLGLMLFATAGLTLLLVRRIRDSEALARQRGIDIASLGKLNEHIVQRLQAGIIVVDHNHNIRLMNDTARKLLDYQYSVEDQPLENISRPLYKQLMAWRKSSQHEPALLKGNASSNILPHFTPMGTGDGVGVMIFLEDTAVMEKQAQQVKLASLGRLTASIAHEIRNPLGAISHATQLLSEDNALANGDRRLMTIIGDNTARVNDIVENILELSRPGTAVPQTVLLKDWLARFADEFSHSGLCTPEQIRCSVDPEDMEIHMDPSQLHQVVWNLCQNSIHHADNDIPLQLTLAGSYAVGSRTPHLDIMDNGPGIDSDMADKIFEPFFTTRSSGTGLGLYIAREICESNQTHLEYLPAAQGGSCFRITFPVNKRLPVASFAQA